MNLKVTNEYKHFTNTPKQVTGNAEAKAERYSDDDKQKLAKASVDFEGLLTSMMIKSMTSTTEGMFGNAGFGGDTMESIFQGEFANFISNSNGMGVADMIYKKITGEKLDKSTLQINNPSFEMNKISKNAIKKDEKREFDDNAAKIPAEYNKAIAPSSKSLNRIDKYENVIDEASRKFGVEKNIIKSVILAESAGNEKAVSPANAKGLMQMIEATAKDMGVKNVFDPEDNIFGGTKYLSGLLRQYNGDLKLALAGYNAGPGNVAKYNGVPPFEETKNYITRVLGYLNFLNE